MAADGHGTRERTAHPKHVLLRSVAEELKLPMLYVARQAELYSQQPATEAANLENLQTNAEVALRLLDSYILGLELDEKQLSLELEPVSLSAVLYDVAHELTPLARQRNTEIELVLAGKYGQVMAHLQGLVAALYSLGSVLSEMMPVEGSHKRIKIGANRAGGGITAGMYVDGSMSFGPAIRTARRLERRPTRQAVTALSAGSGAGIYIADTILGCMQTRLRASRFRGSNGLALTLQPSRQLQLI